MNLNTQHKGIIAAITLLVLATMACATLLGPVTELISEATPTPVLAEQDSTVATEVVESQPTATLPSVQNDPTPVGTEQVALPEPSPSEDLDDLFEPLWEARELIHENFVDQPVDDNMLAQGAIEGLESEADIFDPLPDTSVAEKFADAAGTPNEAQAAFIPFWKAWINAEAQKNADLMQAAIGGMLDSLGDPQTSYMDPDEYLQANIPLEGQYEGIGAWVDPDGEYLTIVSPMPGSPAEEVGLEPGDEIIKVDGEDMTGVDGNLVIRKVLGPAGSTVHLTVRREGEPELLEFEVTRAEITIPSIQSEMLDENIAYVQLFNFGADTPDDLRESLTDLLAENPGGLILDLRNNGGGFLRAAVEITSEFIEDGVVLYEVYGDGSRDVHDVIEGGLATEIPLVVLVNEGSASASEILAGAVQDYDRGPLVGTNTFGKGSVQNWIPLSNDQGAIRVTIARWFTPDERSISDDGLTPDVVVELDEEDVAADRDPQLEKAIELLTDSSN